jgi:transposase-like protein
MKYTIKDFNKQFKDDSACLDYIYQQRFPEGAACEKCGVKDHFYPVVTRRSYACQCGFQLYPTVGTIFHKSPTSLKTWFFAMFLMTASKNGVSAKELERQLGVTYKCAWRMAHQIRQLLNEETPMLRGTVEADETYIGGVHKFKEKFSSKTPVIGLLERGGDVMAKVVEKVDMNTLIPNIKDNVEGGSTLMTDELRAYKAMPKSYYRHYAVRHSAKEYVRGLCHTNSIEGFWSQLKRSINGTFHSVSRKHLQKYVNEFAYRYNRRKSETPMFLHLAASVAEQHAPAV